MTEKYLVNQRRFISISSRSTIQPWTQNGIPWRNIALLSVVHCKYHACTALYFCLFPSSWLWTFPVLCSVGCAWFGNMRIYVIDVLVIILIEIAKTSHGTQKRVTEREEDRFERIYIVPSEILKGHGSVLFPCRVEAILHDLSPTPTTLKLY